jgi:UPF0042 nucleotide-binding protein
MTNKLLIVTGLSGAGMSSALKSLEDVGYEVLDNFPLSLIDPLLSQGASDAKNIAIGIDARTRGFDPSELLKTIENYGAELLFITCDDTILQKRFTETRRRHPLAKDRTVKEGIKLEHELLAPVQDRADYVIDTTSLSIHDLRRMTQSLFAPGQSRLMTTIMSFGYKNGLPREADSVIDVRFLKNPHWEEDLKPLTGKDRKVMDYINEDESIAPFLANLKHMLEITLPLYNHEGKNYLTIAFGCTGGKHRSVFIAEIIAGWLKQNGQQAHVIHRDMPDG